MNFTKDMNIKREFSLIIIIILQDR